MNYITEIKAFYDLLETNPLPPPAIAVWHALMHIANKTGWQQEFAVAVSVLEVKTGLNAKAIERARNKLAQAGLIAWKKRAGNQAAVYTVIPLCDKLTGDFVAQPVAQCVAQCVAQPVAINKHKQNETKQKEREDALAGFDGELRKKLEEWLRYKQERREGYKPTGLRSFVSEVQNKRGQFTDAQICALIGECMANGWKGIIWDKLKAPVRQNASAKTGENSSLDPDKLHRILHGG